MSETFAVIIGNNAYYNPYQLNNAIFDANAIKDVFVNLGYDVSARRTAATMNQKPKKRQEDKTRTKII